MSAVQPGASDGAAQEIGTRQHLDFLFDASGWRSHGESHWHHCGEGAMAGREMLALALADQASSPIPVSPLADIAAFVRQSASRGLPLILILGGGRIVDEARQQAALSNLLTCLSAYRNQAPVVAAALRPLVGPLALAVRLADIVCLGPQGSLALADEPTVRQVLPSIGETQAVGVLDSAFACDASALLGLRQIVNLLPAGNGWEWREHAQDDEDIGLDRLIGADPDAAIDGRRLLRAVCDGRTFVELGHRDGLIVALARIGGRAIGVLASDSAAMSGVLDAAALSKATLLVQFCARHDLPVVTLADSPGVLPDGPALVALGNLVQAWSDCPVAVIGLISRRVIGVAAAALLPLVAANRTIFHWPGARVGLLRETVHPPGGQQIAPRHTRRALVAALRSVGGTRA